MIAGLRKHRASLPVQKAPINDPRPEEQWPWSVRFIAALREPGEKGVGDTMERLVKATKVDQLARAYEEVSGASCGCAARKANYNHRYPYLTQKQDSA